MSDHVPRLSEEWWAERGPHVVRCQAIRKTGDRCRRVAIAGSVVCRHHGGAAPQVRRRAAERIIMAADDAVQKLVSWLHDESVPLKERRLIASDLLDRAQLAGKSMHEVEVKHKWEALMDEAVELTVITDTTSGAPEAEDDESEVARPALPLPHYEPEPEPRDQVYEPDDIIEAEIVHEEPPAHLREGVRGDGNRYRR